MPLSLLYRLRFKSPLQTDVFLEYSVIDARIERFP